MKSDREPSVVADQLCKTYRLGEFLRLEGTLRALIGRAKTPQHFDALNDVSFSTYPGECFGIVGTNGSGKSTVLQILAGITLPTRGTMTVRGTVLPLLAVGAGFHIELTGRENSFLFGTILGLDRDLINSRLDQIAHFAELDRHFDTPIKRYSSGMQSRLCFAIAMLFPASIYCFDEVLAVVDGEFKDRCLQEMRALATAGSTVFFISHDLGQMSALCDRVLWLEQGVVRELGTPAEILPDYERFTSRPAA
jgi:ABC-type polysaccharide/polyol phosphate transport system ATPase subunit